MSLTVPFISNHLHSSTLLAAVTAYEVTQAQKAALLGPPAVPQQEEDAVGTSPAKKKAKPTPAALATPIIDKAVEKLKKTVESLQSDKAALQVQLSQASSTIQDLKSKNRVLTGQVTSKEKLISQLSHQMEALKVRLPPTEPAAAAASLTPRLPPSPETPGITPPPTVGSLADPGTVEAAKKAVIELAKPQAINKGTANTPKRRTSPNKSKKRAKKSQDGEEEDEEDEDEEYYVDQILDHKEEDGTWSFWVRWYSFGEEDDSWVTLDDLDPEGDMIKDYMQSKLGLAFRKDSEGHFSLVNCPYRGGRTTTKPGDAPQ